MAKGKNARDIIIRKTGKDFTAWFAASQSFVRLRGPSEKIIRKIQNGESDAALEDFLSTTTSYDKTEIREFISGVHQLLDQLGDPSGKLYSPPPFPDEDPLLLFKQHSVHTYRIQDESFRIEYGSAWIRDQLHPSLSHHALPGKGDSDHNIRVFSGEGLLYLFADGKLIEHFKSEDFAYLKGAFLKTISGLIHCISESDWMATFHASAISNGHSLALFPARPGAGKSTIAALMQRAGYIHFSDDFIPVRYKDQLAVKSPLAISVKEGSYEFLSEEYPLLKETMGYEVQAGKKVRFLPPVSFNSTPYLLPVRSLIFIRYKPGVSLRVERPGPEKVLPGLLEEAWINPSGKNVAAFLEWFGKLDIFQVTYSDNQSVINAITRIFPHA